ncbi:MAG: alpha/beta hydrolase domain-containing protein [Acidimicrobiia bacterium]
MSFLMKAVALGAVLLLAACASGGDDDNESAPSTSAAADTTVASTMPAVERPTGPTADVSEELTGGRGVFIGTAIPGQLDPGYVEHEFVAAGTATAYTAADELTADGAWTLAPSSEAEYRTRVLVRRPEDPADFSGTVLVEWLNVSGGVDADPDYVTTHEEIARQGHIWVGVSAQLIGVEGGPVFVRVEGPGTEVAGKGLKGIDPARYGSLMHPGDAFSFDIYTQVARALGEDEALLGGVKPAHIVALGESQSAFALVTYINGVQPLTHAFDGFFVHSRGAAGLALVEPGEAADITDAIGRMPSIIRTDTDVPVFEFQTESDVTSVIGSLAVRQPDTDTFRLWEVAGTAHADTRLVGDSATYIDCGVPINDGPPHVVAKAALRHLVTWITTGAAPPQAPLLEVNEASQQRRDADGIALGGVRTPPVSVPVRVLSSAQGPAGSVICLLLGSTTTMPTDRIVTLHGTRPDFETQYAAAVDEAIAGGFVLEEDRAAIDAYAHPELVPE